MIFAETSEHFVAGARHFLRDFPNFKPVAYQSTLLIEFFMPVPRSFCLDLVNLGIKLSSLAATLKFLCR